MPGIALPQRDEQSPRREKPPCWSHINRFGPPRAMAVLEGDMDHLSSCRPSKLSCGPVCRSATGQRPAYLDAAMGERRSAPSSSAGLSRRSRPFFWVENVGNLVCPVPNLGGRAPQGGAAQWSPKARHNRSSPGISAKAECRCEWGTQRWTLPYLACGGGALRKEHIHARHPAPGCFQLSASSGVGLRRPWYQWLLEGGGTKPAKQHQALTVRPIHRWPFSP